MKERKTPALGGDRGSIEGYVMIPLRGDERNAAEIDAQLRRIAARGRVRYHPCIVDYCERHQTAHWLCAELAEELEGGR